MNKNHIRISIGVTGIVLFFALVIVFLINFGFFDFTGDMASAKIVASTIILVSGLIGSFVTIIGIILKNSIDQRNTNLKEDAERRYKLEAGIQAIKLLSTGSGTAVPLTQRAGVLFTLAHLKLSDLAITLLNQMLPNGEIDANTAAWLINHVLEFKKPGDLSIEATGVLNDYHDKFLVAKGYYEFPKCLNLKWNMKLPKMARRNAALALLNIVVKRKSKDWNIGAFSAVSTTLISIWKDETNEEIRNGVGNCLEIILKPIAGGTIELESGEIKVNDIIFELKGITFLNTSAEFVNVYNSIVKWN
jgi:hypothetical protein